MNSVLHLKLDTARSNLDHFDFGIGVNFICNLSYFSLSAI